jgi:hypothetical protein
MQPKNPLFQKCLACLESLPSIQGVIQSESYFSSEVLADGKLTIQTSNSSINYICEIKTGLTSDVIEQTADYFFGLSQRLKQPEKPLLITRGLSNLVVDRLLEKNIEFIDVDGNIYLNSPGIYVLVRNQISKESESKSFEITAAALQVIYAVLNRRREFLSQEPTKAIEAASQTISLASGVTPKTVKSTLKKLQELDYITYEHGWLEIIDYVKLLERWELGYSERLRAKLLLGTFTPIKGKNFSDISDQIQEHAEEFNYLIGGELGGSVMTNYLHPLGTVLHLNSDSIIPHIAVRLKLKPDPDGTIIFLQKFGIVGPRRKGMDALQNNLANPLLIHAELVRTGNSRLKETAQIIYDRYIEEFAQKHDYV